MTARKRGGRHQPAAIAVESSENRKIGACSATYVSQGSCPPDCPHYDDACYGLYGPTGIIFRRLTEAPARGPLALALEEAAAIDRLSGDHPLRGRVVGDSRTPASARIFREACRRFARRGGWSFGSVRRHRGPGIWTYNHAWRLIPRRCWGGVSVLASCEDPHQAVAAMERGYAAALIVPTFRSERVHQYGPVRLLPCPWETRRITCRECRLCFDDQRLLAAGLVIGFTPHGAGASTLRHSLPLVA